eukprot:4559037-Prymnesium_polylepis.1
MWLGRGAWQRRWQAAARCAWPTVRVPNCGRAVGAGALDGGDAVLHVARVHPGRRLRVQVGPVVARLPAVRARNAALALLRAGHQLLHPGQEDHGAPVRADGRLLAAPHAARRHHAPGEPHTRAIVGSAAALCTSLLPLSPPSPSSPSPPSLSPLSHPSLGCRRWSLPTGRRLLRCSSWLALALAAAAARWTRVDLRWCVLWKAARFLRLRSHGEEHLLGPPCWNTAVLVAWRRESGPVTSKNRLTLMHVLPWPAQTA